jgi:hypothetical protein
LWNIVGSTLGRLSIPEQTRFEENTPSHGQAGGQSRSYAPFDVEAYIDEFLGTAAGLALIKAFTAIRSAKLRASIIRLVEEIDQDQKR